MSSLIKKTINGNQYYYIVDSKRVNGKPTHINQVYLGSVNEVIQILKEGAGAASPVYSTVLEFGAAAGCLKHTIHGDFNLVGFEETLALMHGDGSGRIQR